MKKILVAVVAVVMLVSCSMCNKNATCGKNAMFDKTSMIEEVKKDISLYGNIEDYEMYDVGSSFGFVVKNKTSGKQYFVQCTGPFSPKVTSKKELTIIPTPQTEGCYK